MKPLIPFLFVGVLLGAAVIGLAWAAQPRPSQPAAQPKTKGEAKPVADSVEEAQTPRKVEAKRPEQKLSKHDVSDAFTADNAPVSSRGFKDQPDDGVPKGFDFYRDPLNASKPNQSPEEIMLAEKKAKKDVMSRQKELLESRYNLQPKHEDGLVMTRGKPIPVGPTARLAKGTQ